MEKDRFKPNDLYSRIYIDAHLCKPQCSDLQNIDYKSGKGVIYLTMFRGPWIVAIFMQNNGYNIITDEICNHCGERVEILRTLSEKSKRKCTDCNDYFILETVSWSTHSFTIYNNKLVRDKQLSQCEKHYIEQDEIFI